MKVLKTKEYNENLATMEVTCTGKGFSPDTGCGCLLEVNGLDIQKGFGQDYLGDTTPYYYIKCPRCNARTMVYRTPENSNVFDIVH
jgi:hypothetical protein